MGSCTSLKHSGDTFLFHLFGKIYFTDAGNIQVDGNYYCYLTHINTDEGIGK